MSEEIDRPDEIEERLAAIESLVDVVQTPQQLENLKVLVADLRRLLDKERDEAAAYRRIMAMLRDAP